MVFRGMTYPFIFTLVHFASAQPRSSCPSITVNDLGSTTDFSKNGLVPLAESASVGAGEGISVRIFDYHVVCDASGTNRNTSSFVSVLVQFQCNFPSRTNTLADCDGTTMVTRQYQFSCVSDLSGQNAEWNDIVSGNSLFVQTLNPTATFMTPLDNLVQCIGRQ